MANTVSDDFRDELTCPICINVYVQPLRLPCGHSYCRSCVVNMVKPVPQREARYTGERQLPCPECRQLYPIPLQGVDAVFRPDFKLARLVEVLDRVEKRASQQTLETQPSLPDLTEPLDGGGEAGPASFYDNVGEEALPQHFLEHAPPFPVAPEEGRTVSGNHGNPHHGNASVTEQEGDSTGRKVAASPRVSPERGGEAGQEGGGARPAAERGSALRDSTRSAAERPQTLSILGAGNAGAGVHASPQLPRVVARSQEERRSEERDGAAGAPGQRDNSDPAGLPFPRAGTPLRGSNSSLHTAQVTPRAAAGARQAWLESRGGSQERGAGLPTPDLSLPSDPAISGLSALSSDDDTLVPEESSIVELASPPGGSAPGAAAGAPGGASILPDGQSAPSRGATDRLPPTGAGNGGARPRSSPGSRRERSSPVQEARPTAGHGPAPPARSSSGSARDWSQQAENAGAAELQPAAAARRPESVMEGCSSGEGSSEGSGGRGGALGRRAVADVCRGPSASPEGTRSQSSRASSSSRLGLGMKLKKFFSSLLSLDSSDDDVEDEDSAAPSSSDSARRQQKKESSSSMSSYDNDNDKDERLSLSSSSSDEEQTRRKYLFDDSSDSD